MDPKLTDLLNQAAKLVALADTSPSPSPQQSMDSTIADIMNDAAEMQALAKNFIPLDPSDVYRQVPIIVNLACTAAMKIVILAVQEVRRDCKRRGRCY